MNACVDGFGSSRAWVTEFSRIYALLSAFSDSSLIRLRYKTSLAARATTDATAANMEDTSQLEMPANDSVSTVAM